MNATKPAVMNPMTPSTRATVSCGSLRLVKATKNPHQVSIKAQNKIEPSWLPQEAATL